MNKTELIDHISKETVLTKSVVEKVFKLFFETIKLSLQDEVPVTIVGFGSFTVRPRAPRTGRNPQTGETIKIGASKVIAFKAGKELKDAVKNKDK